MEKFTIKEARILSGMTQVEMAKALGVAESTYNKYEQHKIFMRMDTAYHFAQLVNRDLDSIIFLPREYILNRVKETK